MNIWLKELEQSDGKEFCDLLICLSNYSDVYARPVPADFSLDDYESFKSARIRMKNGVNLPKGVVPTSTYWVMNENEPIGYATLKHELRENTPGGHTGCCLKREYQNKGLGKIVSDRLCEIAYNELELPYLLYTAKNENIQSQKSLEKIGAEFIEEFNGYKYYKIDLEEKFNKERRNIK